MENVTAIRASMTLSKEDEALVDESLNHVLSLTLDLGVELDRHLARVAEIKARLDDARQQHQVLIGVMAKKYCGNGPGTYSFQPETGTFVEEPK